MTEPVEPGELTALYGGRRHYLVETLPEDYNPADESERAQSDEEFNLIGSKTRGDENMHLPVLDLDVPHHLEPSSTPGHGHLYINKPLTWAQYQRVLNVLAEVGIIETGYHVMSVARGQSFVRAPGVTKEDL